DGPAQAGRRDPRGAGEPDGGAGAGVRPDAGGLGPPVLVALVRRVRLRDLRDPGRRRHAGAAPGRAHRPGRDRGGRRHRRDAPAAAPLPRPVLAARPPGSRAPVRTLVPAGEPLTRPLADRWAPGRTLINAYGPTETTVCATAGPVAAGEAAPGLGPPLAGTP